MHNPGLHLFLDDREIHERANVTRFVNRPRKFEQPVLQADQPWEQGCRCDAWGTVLQENDGLLRMWYLIITMDIEPVSFTALAYAESRDGIHWTKPPLGLVEWNGSTANNLFFQFGSGDFRALALQRTGLPARGRDGKGSGFLTNADGFTVVRDDHEPDPAKRYKLFANMQDHLMWAPDYPPNVYPHAAAEQVAAAREMWGQYMLTSPDGIHWTDDPIFLRGNCNGDYMIVSWDERNRQWLLNERPRISTRWRSAGLSVSKDLRNWSEPTGSVFANLEESGFGRLWEWHGGITSFNYGNQDVGFLEKWNNAGFGDTCELLSHRDGEPYMRVAPGQAFLDAGPEGAFDRRQLYPTHNAPIRMGDRLHIYYTGEDCRENERSSIGLAVIGLDRFAGLAHQRREPGSIRTVPLTVAGSHLQVNVEPLLADSEVRVALCYPDHSAIPGYTLEDCLPIRENNVRADVRWKDHPDVAALEGKVVLVHFQVKGSAIYSYVWS